MSNLHVYHASPEMKRLADRRRERIARMTPKPSPVLRYVAPSVPAIPNRLLQEALCLIEREPATLASIRSAVCEHFKISENDLVSARRSLEFVRPRQISMYLAHKLTQFSLPAIGKYTGKRDHTTVLHAIRSTAARMETDPKIRADVLALQARFAN